MIKIILTKAKNYEIVPNGLIVILNNLVTSLQQNNH